MVLYTDRSRITNKIGAASYYRTTGKIHYQHWENDSQFNIHAAELVRIHLAIKHWLNEPTPPTIYQIYTDNQAAGAYLLKLKRPPAQSLVKFILDIINSALQGHHVKLTWILGHVNIDSHEQVNNEAI
jgi:hypothetical protein